MNREDIHSTKIDFKKLLFEVEHPGAGTFEAQASIEAQIGVVGVRKEFDAIRLSFSMRSISESFFHFELAGVATLTFKRRLAPNELKEKTLYKICFAQCVNTIIEVVANNSGRMGLTPIVIEKKVFSDLFNGCVEKLNLEHFNVETKAETK